MRKTLTQLGILAAVSVGTVAHAGHLNTVLEATLDGREEVGADPLARLVGDPDGTGEAYVFGIDGDTTTLCYVLTVEDIQLVPVTEGMAAHIHEAPRDSNGPIVAVLAGPEDGNAADCLTEGEEGVFPTGEAGIVQRILDNPAQFYINVHNPEFPPGAIRGQLANQLGDVSTDAPDTGAPPSAPAAPTGVIATVYSSTALEVFFDRSADSSVVAYVVLRDGEIVGTVQGTSFFEEGLTPGTTFVYTVRAINSQGAESGPSTPIEVTTNSN